MKRALLSSLTAAALMLPAAAVAQDAQTVPTENLQKLSGMQSTGTPMEAFAPVDQTGDYAAQLKKNLEQVKLPDGFKINLYAVVPDARHIAVGPQGVVTFVGTRKDAVWAITDRNKDGAADEVKRFAPSLAFDIPNGPCFSKDGFLYIAERNRILVFPAAEFFYESPDIAVGEVVKQGDLIPKAEESFNHTARVCRIGPDKKLYVQLGQPYNVQPKDKVELYETVGIGGIVRMNQDGSEKEVFSIGHRNPVGMDFHPTTGELWSNDNQVDGLGDDTPPGELNRITGPGQHFGFPYLNGSVRIPDYKDMEPPANTVPPVVETVPHAADLGLMFYTGNKFPAKYKQGVFTAQHGSWNRTVPVGARVLFTPLNDDGTAAGEQEEFAVGWLNENGEYIGRPVDLAQLRDGSILVSDDFAGAVYRISYGN
jgi:glucose/arabinose dehydrogenase